MSTNGKTLKFRAAKLKGFTVLFVINTGHYVADSRPIGSTLVHPIRGSV